MSDVLRLWAIVMFSVVMVMTTSRIFQRYLCPKILLKRKALDDAVVAIKESRSSIRVDMLKLYYGKVGDSSLRIIGHLVYILGWVWLAFYILGIASGSLERGIGYDLIASRMWRITDIFVVFSRLKVVYFYLAGLLLVNSRTFKAGLKYMIQLSIIVSLAVLTGGRGEVFFGVGAFILGVVSRKDSFKRFGTLLVAFSLVLVIYIPLMGSIRETDIYKETSVSQPIERLVAIVRSSYDMEGFKYRISTLGREVYACSDAFLFEKSNLGSVATGYKDLSLSNIFRLLVPKVIHGYSIEKFDGSRIAQRLMNIEFNSTWYPCFSTPADLYRRSRGKGLIYGGAAVGVLLLIADFTWHRVMEMQTSPGTLMLILLPLSFIQSFPFGTVQETIWIWGWDIPKYVALAIAVRVIHDWRLRNWQ